jgi:hypothetical protein
VRRTGGWTVYLGLSAREFPFQQKRFFDEYQAWTAVEAVTDLGRLLVMPQQKILPAPPKPQDTAATPPLVPRVEIKRVEPTPTPDQLRERALAARQATFSTPPAPYCPLVPIGPLNGMRMFRQLACRRTLTHLEFEEMACILTNSFRRTRVNDCLIQKGHVRLAAVVWQVGVENAVDHPHRQQRWASTDRANQFVFVLAVGGAVCSSLFAAVIREINHQRTSVNDSPVYQRLSLLGAVNK